MPRAATDAALASLELVALKAGRTLDRSIELLPQHDAAIGWKAAATHPLQPLEVEYQGIVRDAVRDLRDVERRKEIESALLGDFFFFDAGAPRLLGVPEGEPYQGHAFPLPQDRLREARAQIEAAKRLLVAPGGTIDGKALRSHLQQAWDGADSVRAGFLTFPDSANWPVPRIQKAGQLLAGLPPLIRSTTDLKVVVEIAKRIKQAIAQLEVAVVGAASVQMLYMIESFYLFRLLVRYRIRSDEPIDPDAINEASSTLTGLVTNGHPRLARWLSDKVVDLGSRVTAIDPDNVIFFLKGGRALQCLYGPAAEGQNDWDTQILLNPNLPAADWYRLFMRVSNETLLALEACKREFYMLMHLDPAQFRQEPPQTVEPMDIDLPPDAPFIVDEMDIEDWDDPMEIDPPPPPPRLRANCKAELIDVGLPRYDSVEAREQWAHLRGRIEQRDRVPYPWPLYFVDEYLLIVREVLSGRSPAPQKAPKRVERLFDLLGLDSVRPAIELEFQAIPPVLQPAIDAIGRVRHVRSRFALIVLLRQFATAYGVDKDPEFAQAFAAWFAAELPQAGDYGRYPAALSGAIAGLLAARRWSEDVSALILAVGFGQYVSEAIEAHFVLRGRFMASQQPLLGPFLGDLYRNSIFSQEEELEVQLAIRGSYGAREQALFAQAPRPDELDPVTYVSIGLYSARVGTDPAAVLELVEQPVRQALPAGLALQRDDAARAIRLYWTQPQQFAPLAPYRPLAAEIVAAAGVRRPLLSYVWGLPVLGLGDLLRDYREEAGRIQEFGRQLSLRRTASALLGMIADAANPEPPQPVQPL